VAAVLGAPLLGVAWLARPEWRPGLGERLGRIPAASGGGAIWIHGASVGEATASLRLVEELRRRGHAVRASTLTVTGRAVLARQPDLPAHLAPLDHPFAVERALERARPRALVLVETELWPCWIAAAHRRGLPVLVVSGRISDGALPRYRRFARWLAPTFARLDAVLARSDEDARRFEALGVPRERIEVGGDLKLEPPEPRELPADLDARLGEVPLLVAGSTHEGEESAVLEAFAAVREAGLAAALVLAPRHPARFEDVARRLDASSFPWQRRSEARGGTLAAGEVLLLDSIGELAAVFGRARSTFVGGTWREDVGGHNVLEPIFRGRPVHFGPHTSTARDAARLALEVGAGARVADAAALARAWRRDLGEPEAAARRGAAGRAALAPHEGAARRAADRIEATLAAREPKASTALEGGAAEPAHETKESTVHGTKESTGHGTKEPAA
jgi:3-deoxy-D-manno-octulosonic-acid transferase